eukprot:7023624-Heterocapsa_arctica.AAC.1
MSSGVTSTNLGFRLGTTGEQGIASAVTGTGLYIHIYYYIRESPVPSPAQDPPSTQQYEYPYR